MLSGPWQAILAQQFVSGLDAPFQVNLERRFVIQECSARAGYSASRLRMLRTAYLRIHRRKRLRLSCAACCHFTGVHLRGRVCFGFSEVPGYVSRWGPWSGGAGAWHVGLTAGEAAFRRRCFSRSPGIGSPGGHRRAPQADCTGSPWARRAVCVLRDVSFPAEPPPGPPARTPSRTGGWNRLGFS